jgi:predicted ester cyclase
VIAFVHFLGELHEAFADYRVEMPLIILEGDAAVRMVVIGTHTGELDGIAPKEKEVRWELLAHLVFKDGLVEEQETFRDWMELMSQLQWPASTS